MKGNPSFVSAQDSSRKDIRSVMRKIAVVVPTIYIMIAPTADGGRSTGRSSGDTSGGGWVYDVVVALTCRACGGVLG
jgi:hypothetical protein